MSIMYWVYDDIAYANQPLPFNLAIKASIKFTSYPNKSFFPAINLIYSCNHRLTMLNKWASIRLNILRLF